MVGRRAFKLAMSSRIWRYRLRRLAAAAMVVIVVAVAIFADRAGLFGRLAGSDVESYHDQSFKVLFAFDGDTIAVDLPDEQREHTSVRLWGVDTPETGKKGQPDHHFGPEAAQFTRSLVAGKMVRLELDPRDTRDKYGRLLAYVYLPDGRMLNRVLVERGYAYADPRFPHRYDREFERLMSRARSQRLGLWEEVRQSDLPHYLQGRVTLGSAVSCDAPARPGPWWRPCPPVASGLAAP
jgi:endonuclease YncB( thermonuclease family)